MRNIEHINRREFLKRTGQAGGGLVLALTMTTACQPKGPDVGKGAQSVAPNVYVNIRNDGIVEIICHRSEMGQGIRTCLPQVIADEMDADWDRIEVIQGLGDEKYASQNTIRCPAWRRCYRPRNADCRGCSELGRSGGRVLDARTCRTS